MKDGKVEWWEFWNPSSGIGGGIILGLIIGGIGGLTLFGLGVI